MARSIDAWLRKTIDHLTQGVCFSPRRRCRLTGVRRQVRTDTGRVSNNIFFFFQHLHLANADNFSYLTNDDSIRKKLFIEWK